MDDEIELICGCEISHAPAHGPGCKCGESYCQDGYWELTWLCPEHRPKTYPEGDPG